MTLTDEQKGGLGVALNEACWLGAEVDAGRRLANVTLAVLTLPEEGPAPRDSRIQLLLSRVGRVLAVHKSATGETLPLEIDDLLPCVLEFGGLPVYGWEFFDVPVPALAPADVSLDYVLGVDGQDHVLHLFQEPASVGALDLWIWFRDLEVRTPTGERLPLEAVMAGGKRWWDGLYSGDARTSGHGIIPSSK